MKIYILLWSGGWELWRNHTHTVLNGRGGEDDEYIVHKIWTIIFRLTNFVWFLEFYTFSCSRKIIQNEVKIINHFLCFSKPNKNTSQQQNKKKYIHFPDNSSSGCMVNTWVQRVWEYTRRDKLFGFKFVVDFNDYKN